jgi:hypothetical protein
MDEGKLADNYRKDINFGISKQDKKNIIAETFFKKGQKEFVKVQLLKKAEKGRYKNDIMKLIINSKVNRLEICMTPLETVNIADLLLEGFAFYRKTEKSLRRLQ